MSQLLIVDVQQVFDSSKELDGPIAELTQKYGDVVYCYDVINGEGVWPYDMWSEMAMLVEEGTLNPTIITKEYGFLRIAIDQGISDEDIVDLIRLMKKHNVYDLRDVYEKEDLEPIFQEFFSQKGISIHKDECFFVPDDLLESVRDNVKANVHVVGGGMNECLKEICILLTVLEIPYTIIGEFTY